MVRPSVIDNPTTAVNPSQRDLDARKTNTEMRALKKQALKCLETAMLVYKDVFEINKEIAQQEQLLVETKTELYKKVDKATLDEAKLTRDGVNFFKDLLALRDQFSTGLSHLEAALKPMQDSPDFMLGVQDHARFETKFGKGSFNKWVTTLEKILAEKEEEK